MIGNTLGHYQIAGQLGEGGMGDVFQTYSQNSQRKGDLMGKRVFLCACGFLFSLFWIAASPARSEVTRVEIKSRVEVSGFDYVKILGRIYFAVTPGNPHNRIIVDLDKAKRADDGRVEFSADFFILTPKSKTSGIALVIAPPASQHPRVDRGTLVDVNKLAFPAIPGVQSPHNLKAGFRISNQFLKGGAGFGTELPLLVPQVDADGNERSGIRVPEIAVPLATYTGWNFRAVSVGGTTHLYPLIGSYIPFARTKAERNERNDPRLSVAERYSSRDAYMAKIREAADELVKQRYLLAEDLGSVVARAAAHYELIMGGPEPESR